MCHRSELLSLVLYQPAMVDTVAGATDYRGQPASRAATGGWKPSVFVMGTFPIVSRTPSYLLRQRTPLVKHRHA